MIGQDCLNLGFNDAETSVLIDAVDTGCKGAITYSDLSRRLATADVGRDHDAMLASSSRELQSVRNHAAQLAEGLDNAVQSSGDVVALVSDADDYGDGTHLAVGPLHTRPFSSSNAAADMGATAPGVGWGGKSQSQLFHTISEHDPPNNITLPPQVQSSPVQAPLLLWFDLR